MVGSKFTLTVTCKHWYKEKQGKQGRKITAIRCYKCFSLRLLLATANWLEKKQNNKSCRGLLLTAADRSKKIKLVLKLVLKVYLSRYNFFVKKRFRAGIKNFTVNVKCFDIKILHGWFGHTSLPLNFLFHTSNKLRGASERVLKSKYSFVATLFELK